MNDPIVMKLMKQKRQSLFEAVSSEDIKKYMLEAEEDEEETIEDETEEVSEDPRPEEEETDIPQGSEEEPEESDVKDEETPVDDEVEEEPEEEEGAEKDHVNPLQNDYAVKFQIGDDVAISFANGNLSEITGSIDGYDPEGFYRLRLGDGSTINGITDIALASLKKVQKESKCVCGGTRFVNEGASLVCDECGRQVKSKIYPKPADVSTQDKPTIQEAIKKAFKKKTLNEEEEGASDFLDLQKLKGEFWTLTDEMIEDIEDLGYEVIDSNDEYVVVIDPRSDDDKELQIPVGGTLRTKILDLDKARSC